MKAQTEKNYMFF